MKVPAIQYAYLYSKYSLFKNEDLFGRYISFLHIKDHVSDTAHGFPTEVIGTSFNNIPIHAVTIGTGKIKILAWSQMHGNESTTTKAVFDVINAFKKFPDDSFLEYIKENITLKIIPMLNPDGAEAYTRVNNNNIDLNRDAHNLEEKESMVLRAAFELFKPDFCFNLHDQRTIFSAGMGPQPATLSFLAPAMNEKREITPSRKVAMQVIASMNSDLQELIPNQIGRYDDAYNINCTGDTFQTLGVPTILFEAGHFPNDYQREKTREFFTAALFSGLKSIASGEWKEKKSSEYLEIPENHKKFFDIILRNARVEDRIVDVAIQFSEKLRNQQIDFEPVIEKIDDSLPYYGHKEINLQGKEVHLENSAPLHENVIVNKLHLKNEVLIINYQNI